MVKILHLFPKLMNIYGDYANVKVLKKHLEDQGLKVNIEEKDIDESIYFEKYDFIYMGSGTESSLKIALKEILKYKDDFIKCIDDNKVILFSGNAMELLGKSIDDTNALGVFDFSVRHTEKRYTGDVIVKNDDIGFAVGFINKSTIIEGEETNKLFDYVYTDANLNEGNFEGYHINNTYATHLVGPVLVKNPNFMKKIVCLLLPKNNKYKNIKYNYEIDSYIVTLEALKDR